ncbi:MAG: PEGA domain-containing protein [Deltaproteobacteria bacterium]|nr:MAG: PEGA domain-containing protein [Deltaproteobacteria bacterium]
MTEQPVLGDLRLVRKIAAGGMAEVWEARKGGVEGFEKRVAVKVILSHLTENEEFIRMFLDEGRLAAHLDHPNLCQIIGLGESDGTYYMSMEYIDGMVLSSLMKQAAHRGVYIPFEHCCQIIIGACAGLDYAHSCTNNHGEALNLVHRDISPQNVMLTYNGDIKVVDFGIAKAASQVHHTRAGVLKGKYAYMSPEQATGAPLDRRSDVFALGVVLWELTTGHRLFRADNEIATLHKIIGGDYPPPSAYRDSYPPALELIVQKALATDRDQRFQDCGEMQLALEDFLLRHGLAAGSKRLAHYIQRIMSDEEISDLPEASALLSTGGFSFEGGSNSGVHTPSHLSPRPQALTGSSVEFGTSASSLSGGLGGSDFSSIGVSDVSGAVKDTHLNSPAMRERQKSSSSLWIVLLVLVVLGGGGFGAYTIINQRPTETVFATPWTISSEPRNADIFVNDEFRGKTPKAVMFAPGKRYILSIRHKGYLSSVKEIQKFTSELAAKPLRVTLKEKPKTMIIGSVLVKIKPAQANVLVNGKPLKALFDGVYEGSLPAGVPHTLSVKRKGFKTYSKIFQISTETKKSVLQVRLEKERRSRRRRRVRRRRRIVRRRRVVARRPRPRPRLRAQVLNIVPDAWIAIETNPPGAVVKLDGSVIGSSPLPKYKLTAGKHMLRIEKSGYKSVTQHIRLKAREYKQLTVRFKPIPKKPQTSIVSFGGGPRSRVYIDGKFIGKIPLFGKKVPSGRYVVMYRTLKFDASRKKVVTFRPGKQTFKMRFPMGKIWLLSRPVAKVFLNGDYVGNSMRPPYKVPAGSYKVKFVFGNGKHITKRVKIRGGKKTRVVARLK